MKNLTSEKSLLSCMVGGSSYLNGKEACEIANKQIEGPQSFFDARNAAIYETAMMLFLRGEVVDIKSVCSELETRLLLTDEMRDYMVEIHEDQLSGSSAKFHAKKVKEAYASRQRLLEAQDEVILLENGILQVEIEEDKEEEFQPFPIHVFPSALQNFIVELSESMRSDPSFVVSALLPALASAIGGSRSLRVKEGWNAPAIVWSALVAKTGAKKSPVFEPCWSFVKKKQKEEFAIHKEEMVEFDKSKKKYDQQLAKWKQSKSMEEPPTEPDRPFAVRHWIDDATIEVVAQILSSNARGVLMAKDELSSWLGGFNRYAGGKGNEEAKWLEMFEGRDLVIDRKTGDKPTMYVPRASVSISGGIQPNILKKYMTEEHQDSGLCARFLFAMPRVNDRVWTNMELSRSTLRNVHTTFDFLFNLRMGADEAPIILTMTDAAMGCFQDFYNRNGKNIGSHSRSGSASMAAALSKLEGYAPRLALILNLCTCAETGQETPVDASTMTAAIELTEWYAYESGRIYAMLSGKDKSAESGESRLVEWIKVHGGSISARDLSRKGPKEFRKDTGKLLSKLVKNGYGSWEENDKKQSLFILK